MTIKVDVPEAYATEVNPGDRAQVKLQAMKGKTVAGKVSRITGRSIPARIPFASRSTFPTPAACSGQVSTPTQP